MNDLAQAAAQYLRKESGFVRLLPLMIKKYQSLGRWGGNIVLNNLSAVEVEALTAFFRQSFVLGGDAKISLSQFVAALARTKFDGATAIDVLTCYAGNELVGNQEAQRRKDEEIAEFWRCWQGDGHSTLGQQWLATVAGSGTASRIIASAYERDQVSLRQAMSLVLQALAVLPTAYERLPVFARRLCGNPHALDSDTLSGRLLLEAFKVLAVYPAGDNERSKVEEENEILYSFGLLRDDIQNFITCCGLVTKEFAYWREAWQTDAVLNVPLRELVRISALSCAEPRRRKVFVVENGGVFSALVDWFLEHKLPLPPLVCTHGQFRLAAWSTLERLVAGDCTIWYAGDFDPEGLLMAQRVVVRYQQQARLWRYTIEDYQASLSPVILTGPRLTKLDGVSWPELKPIAAAMVSCGRAGYQEALVEALAGDMVKG